MRYEYRHTVNWDGSYECPVCHSDDIEVDDSGPEDDYYMYEMHCCECDAVFKQWYSLHPMEVDYCTKEEAEEQERAVPNWTYNGDTFTITMPSTSDILAVASSVIATTTSSGHCVWAPGALAPEPIRHNYDLAPDFGENKRRPTTGYVDLSSFSISVDGNHIYGTPATAITVDDIANVPQCQCDSVTRNLLLGQVDWEAVARSLQEE